MQSNVLLDLPRVSEILLPTENAPERIAATDFITIIPDPPGVQADDRASVYEAQKDDWSQISYLNLNDVWGLGFFASASFKAASGG